MGDTVMADTSGIGDGDGLTGVSFSYRWLRDDGTGATEIAGATSSAYTVSEDDPGQSITARVSFTDDAGNAESLTSAPVVPIAVISAQVPDNSPATGTPSVSGTARVGETLTADTSGIADADGLDNVEYAYRWLPDDTEVPGTTSSSYTLTTSEQGKTVRVRGTFTDDAGNAESLTSAPTAAIAAAGPTSAPPAPQNLAAVANDDGTITLSWTAPDDDFITGYRILRRRPREGGGHAAGVRGQHQQRGHDVHGHQRTGRHPLRLSREGHQQRGRGNAVQLRQRRSLGATGSGLYMEAPSWTRCFRPVGTGAVVKAHLR